jgi:hypothetical protein|eukprot:COSAG01_NODE_1403_length_10445_cov_67.595399_2_plen_187_part_00
MIFTHVTHVLVMKLMMETPGQDGCNVVGGHAGYATGYPKMGHALQASGRDIVYSCSWPAYMGSNESTKPFEDMIKGGCNLWRNWHDIQGNWGSVSSIIDHWGDYGEILQATAGPDGPYGGHWHDMDMLLIGEHELGGLPGITWEEGRTQFGMWSLLAARTYYSPRRVSAAAVVPVCTSSFTMLVFW